ncbi:MAG: glutamine amidotransferase [Acidimicrobiia bacterium]|nr:glutamine amidotransferase [Acidimicrobiia bacterium]
MSTPTVRLWHLYPREMNIYADRGNIAVLGARLRRRGLDLALREGGPGEVVPGDGVDLVYLGGGQDRDQLNVAADLAATKAADLRALLGGGAVGLFVCGGYQLAGHRYRTAGGELVAGLGVLDIETTAGPDRLIGDIVLRSDLGPGDEPDRLVGYENHAGRTTLGAGAAPLGRVVKGHGNNGRDRSEGAVADRTVGTYLHGPLLPKNPWLADLLLGWALEHRYRRPFDLEPLDDHLEQAAHRAALARANNPRR